MKPVILLFSLLFTFLCQISFSQILPADSVTGKTLYRNSVYGELGGNSNIGFSGNYERLFPLKSGLQITFAIRAGLGKLYNPFLSEPLLIFPTEVSVYGGRGLIKPEVGLGLTYALISEPGNQVGIGKIVRLGIKLQKPGSHFFGRAGISSWFANSGQEPDKLLIFRLLGFSMGYSFGK